MPEKSLHCFCLILCVVLCSSDSQIVLCLKKEPSVSNHQGLSEWLGLSSKLSVGFLTFALSGTAFRGVLAALLMVVFMPHVHQKFRIIMLATMLVVCGHLI